MESGFNLIWVLLQTIVALAAVCGLAYLIFRVVLPRLQIVPGAGANGMVRVVERVSLDAKRSLFVVEVAGKWLLIGVSENGVNFVGELDAAEAVAAETEIISARAEQIQKFKNLPSDFAETLRRATTGKKLSVREEEREDDEKKQPAFSGEK